ncbi:protocadherin 2 gamma 28 isoform X33 [Alosa sapidissima]|uniref:protocadherin 2 gamma 28 isoform X33 n=1 Tax=Alosa sapidissima TaxID=34773 RepID=UPI001C092E7F|nr:protocadherin 2 gamma 28 isoform X33 [Alosa sapidissima]
MPDRTMALQVLVFLVLVVGLVRGQVSYSIPEEMPKGSVVGNIAQDLGLDLKRLKSGNGRIYTGNSATYIDLNKERGVLLVIEKIDREAICKQITPCALHLQIILEDPIEFYSVNVEITDINDNAPVFKTNEMKFEIMESLLIGARFDLERAIDNDVGVNGLQSYLLDPTDNFALKSSGKSSKNVEMVLQKPLDREKQPHIALTLSAMDGGDPQMTGTMQILITVLDANDNAPICSQSLYKASVEENSPKGTVLATVRASDADEGLHGLIQYSIANAVDGASELFKINDHSGILSVSGNIDFEIMHAYEFDVRATDHGGHSDTCKVIIDIIDNNDNKPVINIMSKSKEISENSKLGTVIAAINVQDADSGDNGNIRCSLLDRNLPFTLRSESSSFFSLITDNEIDRERQSEYNVTVLCSDEGVPSLFSSVTLSLLISDVNDNAPVFEKSTYEAAIIENNKPGHSIFAVKATDADWKQNARISYMLEDSMINGVSVSSFVSVSVDSGVIHAVRSFDFEQLKDFNFRVKAQDGGSPPLSSNVSVKIVIQDQNDNAPQILYPVQTSGSLVTELVPRSADVGYLVTKVVAVDVDSGQNAWLSYKLQKGTDRALFDVGAQNGEIRTIRQVIDKDAVKQKLTVVVEDNGQPSRSATVNVNVALADSFPEVLSEFTDFTHKEYNDNLTFYLVLALAVVSFLFIVSIIAILSVKCYRWRREQMFYKSNGNLPVIPYYPPLYTDPVGTGTLQHVYNYEVCRTADSRKSDLKYGRSCSQSIISLDTAGTLPHAQKGAVSSADFDEQQKPPNQDWRFNQNQRPGPSGAAATPEVAVGTGPWPNPPTEAEQLQALMAAANGASHTSSPPLYSSPRSCLLISEVSEATNTLTPGTMGLSTRYSPQFTLQHVPDYRQNVYIPGSTATLTSNPQQQQQQQLQLQQQMLPNMPPQQALPPAQATGPDGAAGGGAPGAQSEPPKAAQTPASKKKSTKKEKK